ncbi:MAG: inositol monophosphatase [Oscillospiraceae bacterium]|nr:inositol monophosphatase [Oscillospiraceae bacterium]
MSKLLEEIKEIVRETAAIMLEVTPEALEVAAKEGHGNFVTDYDVRVQKMLFERLEKVLPEAEFLGEEGEGDKVVGAGYTFIIDPIDGTSNFICGYGHSAISVALALDGEFVIGVVYNPYRDEMYWAEKGEGSFLNGRKLTMVDRPMEKGLVACGTAPYRLDLTDKTFDTMKKVFLNSMDLRRVGSAALDLCFTAANRNVLFFEWVQMPWDYAAASLLITEAGGVFSQMDGSPVKPGDICSILAGTKTAVEDFHRVTGI